MYIFMSDRSHRPEFYRLLKNPPKGVPLSGLFCDHLFLLNCPTKAALDGKLT